MMTIAPNTNKTMWLILDSRIHKMVNRLLYIKTYSNISPCHIKTFCHGKSYIYEIQGTTSCIYYGNAITHVYSICVSYINGNISNVYIYDRMTSLMKPIRFISNDYRKDWHEDYRNICNEKTNTLFKPFKCVR